MKKAAILLSLIMILSLVACGGNQTPTNPGTTTKVTGTVKLNAGTLNVRSGAGTGNKVISYYSNGAKVEILEQKTVGSTIWGRTDKGWISLDYVKLDEIVEDDNTNDDNTDDGNTDSGNTDDGNTDSGNTDSGNTDSGNTDGGNTDSGNTDSGNTDGGNTGDDNTDDDDNAGSSNPTITVLTGKVNAIQGHLNVRKEATTQSNIVGRLYAGNSVVIYEKKTVGSMTWGRIATGWICMDYVTITSETTTTQKTTGTITATKIRVRSGAGGNYTIVDYLYQGDKVEILDRKTVDGVEWGRVSKGWIMMEYVKLDSTSNPGSSGNTGSNAGGNTGSNTDSSTKIGTVKLNAGTLNVRAGAGLTYRVVSYLVNGAKVTILETKTVNGTTWGKISTGWVCMDYIKF